MSSRLHFPLRSEDYRAPGELSGLAGRGLVVGGLAAAATVAGAFMNTPQFFHCYLVAWLLWFMVGLGLPRPAAAPPPLRWASGA